MEIFKHEIFKPEIRKNILMYRSSKVNNYNFLTMLASFIILNRQVHMHRKCLYPRNPIQKHKQVCSCSHTQKHIHICTTPHTWIHKGSHTCPNTYSCMSIHIKKHSCTISRHIRKVNRKCLPYCVHKDTSARDILSGAALPHPGRQLLLISPQPWAAPLLFSIYFCGSWFQVYQVPLSKCYSV